MQVHLWVVFQLFYCFPLTQNIEIAVSSLQRPILIVSGKQHFFLKPASIEYYSKSKKSNLKFQFSRQNNCTQWLQNNYTQWLITNNCTQWLITVFQFTEIDCFVIINLTKSFDLFN